MKVYLLDPILLRPDATDYHRACHDGLAASAALDQRHRHERVEHPGEADLILAASQGLIYGPHFQTLRASAVYRAHRRKVVCYCPDDMIYASLPGIYPAATPYWVAKGWACGGHYISSHIHRHHFDPAVPAAEREFLFSFVGSSWTSPLRERVLALRHARALLQDSASKTELPWYDRGPQVMAERYAFYRQGLNRTKFALCPRGLSASSIRLFEALEAGCVPVILADDIVLPTGPDWDAFCVRVPEAAVASIPARLEAVEGRFEAMSVLARAAWEEFFSPAVTFDRLAEWGGGILRALAAPGKRMRLEWQARLGEYVVPGNLRVHARHAVRRLRARVRKT